jgi:hypothetical protein
MPQQTNLNVAPYFDDFDANNDYHRVLFKPGYPVQARELTTLQSILQNQIEKFGQHFFKEGAKVIPGNTGYTQLYYCVQLQNTYLGVPVSSYADQLVGSKITGQISGVTAIVDKVLLPQDSERGNLTLYINYLNSSTQNNSTQQFLDGESLTSNITITSGLLGNTSITVGQPFAVTIANEATTIGSAFSITEGVYFIRGQFIPVESETLILDQYGNLPNYRVGLFINEEIINSDIDELLNDNSQGFNNYSAPGADRLKISVSLFKKSLDEFDDNNFIELATINEGILRSETKNTKYSIIADELARRTYNESGDYAISPFDISIKESLNNNLGNRGIFNEGQFTYGGSSPSEDLVVYQISPGKAIIRGYEVETISTTFLDVEKTRTTKTLENQSINYNTGPTFKLNNVYGAPIIGIGNTYVLSLRDERVGSSQDSASGKEIGVARVYDFKLESGSYNFSNQSINEWDISLYDIQTITEITLNEPITLSTPTFIQGANSGATAFLKDSVSESNLITLYETKGNFLKNESFIFDGIKSGYVAVAVTSYGTSDIKSVYGSVGSASIFSADTIQSTEFDIGIALISQESSGISTITSPNISFPRNIIKIGNIISYSDTSLPDPVYAKVVSIGSTSVNIVGASTVIGVSEGKLPSSELEVIDLKVLTTELSSSSDNTLYVELPKDNISSLDLNNASLVIRKSFNVNISSNELSVPVTANTNEFFLPFDEERYSLIRSDGSTEVLTSDKFAFIDGGKQLQIYNLGTDDTNASLTTTLRKIKPKSKIKRKNRVNSIVVDKSKYEGSGIGATTLNDGLIFGNYPYGTRVQDKNISLNVPDIIEIHGIFESADTSNPSAPKMVLSSINGPSNTTSDLIIGEEIVGQNGTTIAIVAEKLTNSQISFVYKNQNTFKEGESVTFRESNIQAIITTLDSPSFNVSFNYTFSVGQKGTFYDYGYITRKKTATEPNKKIRIYFSNGFYDSSDDGDITTANSYNTFNYSDEITTVNNIRVSDIIDIRPRVSPFTVFENTRSPFEFYGRVFNSSGNSAANILASDEEILTSFSFYLGRIDRVYLTKDGSFQIKYGTPSEKPEKPVSVDDALELATIELPPYLYSTSDASIRFLEHKRYRMVDIKQLENRIKNLEYYTTLSLLETNTANLFIPDSDGLNRFKSGFFVDNFTSTLSQESDIEIKNSIDIKNKELRPKHYTNSIDLIFGPVSNVDPNEDLQFSPLEGVNVRKTGDIVTLDYAEVEWLKQSFATRFESVTPFLVNFWKGTLEITPASDTWVDTVRVDAKIINMEGNYSETLAVAERTLNVDPQTGFAPTVWNSWIDNWTGQERVESTQSRTITTTSNNYRYKRNGKPRILWNRRRGRVTTTSLVVEDTIEEIRDTGTATRTGVRTAITEQFDQTSIGDRIISRDLITFMRSRNIQFVTKRIKPLTQLYAFFDGVDVTDYCIPKLLEVSMVSGVFEVGETVIGTINETGLGQNLSDELPKITFRIAQSNHKEGPYNLPTSVFGQSPYDGQIIPATYSSTSSILNIDTFSLSNEPQGSFSGWVESGMTLTGSVSGAQAVITDVRLISDISATLIGSLFIPNPNIDIHPRFESGVKVLTFVNDESNDQNLATTLAEERFSSSGILETIQENIISIRNARIESRAEFEEIDISRTTGSQVVESTPLYSTSTTFSRRKKPLTGRAARGLTPSQRRNQVTTSKNCYKDPLAQSFFIDDPSGIFLTRCDIFFKSTDTDGIPVTVQLRTMQNGVPSEFVLPFSEIVLDPTEVQTSDDSSVATPIVFKSPIYLEGGKEYCICLLSNSTKYNVFISRVGENDLLTQTFISNQPYLGSLFKSQNASTWEPSQWEDLKFIFYRADFIESGTVEIYNPQLSEGNNQIAKLMPNSLNFNSKRVRISLASTVSDLGLTIGNTILQTNTNASANYVSNAGIATGPLNVINSGIGYTPSSGIATFTNISLESITGNGRDAIAEVTISNGVAIAATIISGGSGYQVGDVLGITNIGLVNVGRNARFSLSSISNINQIIVDNVQGDFVVGFGNTIQYVNNLGITTYLNGTGAFVDEIIEENDGLHIKVDHRNHGMYFNDNLVAIYNAQSDIKPTKLSAQLLSDSSSSISVNNSGDFSIFENVGVGTTNPGYLIIGEEIIEYTSVSPGVIGGNIVRGPSPKTYPVGTPVYKYELNGISLNRINKTHNLNDVTIVNPITFDSYYIKIDTSNNGINRSTDTGYPALYSNQTKSTGGYNIRATQNIPFEIITPVVQNLTVRGTSISAEVRTIAGQSISGNEVPFTDVGFESITINSSNYLDSARIIASKVNEDNKLSNLPGNKSLNMRLTLGTTDTRLSPVIDTQRISTILTSNRINSVIENYAEDNRVNDINEDPSAFQYISKEIVLESPASSIKIILNAHINPYSDIRALYAIGENPNFEPIFTPFPGYNNLDSRGQIINFEDSNGLSDRFISPSNYLGFTSTELDYREYTFTADNLPSFRSYRIKLVATSINQVYVPRVRDLRVIALA